MNHEVLICVGRILYLFVSRIVIKGKDFFIEITVIQTKTEDEVSRCVRASEDLRPF